MNSDSVDCRRLPFPFPTTERVPGDFAWAPHDDQPTRQIYIVLPGDKYAGAIECQLGAPGGDRIWGWDGNEDKPTFTPSISVPGCWHGHLIAGRLVSC